MALAVVAAILLRRVRPSSEPERQPGQEPEGAVAGSAGVEYGGE
jgi:protein tyrosine phosphatase (PTP) superfamily phosphohydrolase (DUF442 family)